MGRIKKRKVHHHQQQCTLTVSDSQLENLFHKCFTYHTPDPQDDRWVLPEAVSLFTSPHWSISELQRLLDDLNSVKNLLSEIDIIKWHAHTSTTHKAGLVINDLKTSLNPELCTQAWCKFTEILHKFPIVLPVSADQERFTSLHICEAPGAFVTALNHYIKCLYPDCNWKWHANTLNPYYEGNSHKYMIDDDRFILKTLPSWYFGSDKSGNIMSQENLKGLKNVLRDSQVNLVTADGSIDCADDPSKQEFLTSQLHYCEAVTALHYLTPGGALVLKMFTLVEDSSVGLMYLLNCAFTEVNVFKPTTSKPGNSEVYVAALGYQGLSAEILQALLSHGFSERPAKAMMHLDQIPESFLNQHKSCCETFTSWQKDTILSNLALYQTMNCHLQERLEADKRRFLVLFHRQYQLESIGNRDRIVAKPRQVKPPCGMKMKSWSSKQRHKGTFTERQQHQLSWKQRIYQQQEYDVESDSQVLWFERHLHSLTPENLVIEQGAAYSQVVNSPFCSKDILEQYNDFLTNSKFMNFEVESLLNEQSFKQMFEIILGELSHVQMHGSPVNQFCIAPVPGLANTISHFLDSDKLKTALHFCTTTGRAECDGPLGHIMCLADLSTPGEEVKGQKFSKADYEIHNVLSFTCLTQLPEAIKLLKAGDHMVLMTGALISRLSASLIYLLHTMFTKVGVCSLPSGSESLLCVVCASYQSIPGAVRDIVDEAVHILLHPVNHRVLSLVSIETLKEPSFSAFLTSVNDAYLKRRLNFLHGHEKSLMSW